MNVSYPELYTLRSRQEFLAIASTKRRWVTKSFLLQADPASTADGRIGIGFTASKKVGNAVARNRAKRRLREIARYDLATYGENGWRYVLVARAIAREIPLERMRGDLKWALKKLAHDADLKSNTR